jgi:hypothetical protein
MKPMSEPQNTLVISAHSADFVWRCGGGFAFAPWIWFILAMTLAGRVLLIRMSDKGFKRALDVILVLISLRLIWVGVTG